MLLISPEGRAFRIQEPSSGFAHGEISCKEMDSTVSDIVLEMRRSFIFRWDLEALRVMSR